MRQAIRGRCSDAAVVAVVCGAWHVPALDPDGSTRRRRRELLLRGLAKVEGRRHVGAVDASAAASASTGLRRRCAPARAGTRTSSPTPAPTACRGSSSTPPTLLRRQGMPASPDHLIAASRLATALAALRGRPRPGLAEVLDAADAVLGGLAGSSLDELVVGDAIGDVPPDAPQVPLARDLAAAPASGPTAPEPVAAHRRARPPHAQRRCADRGCCTAWRRSASPWGVLEEGRGSSGTFRETWRGAWEPELSVRLVERAGHGTTVDRRGHGRLVERAAAADRARPRPSPSSSGAARRPARRRRSGRRRASARQAADAPDVAELMDALGPLAAALRYGDVRGTDAVALPPCSTSSSCASLAGLAGACRRLDEDAARRWSSGSARVQAALAVVDHPARARGPARPCSPSWPTRAGSTGSVQGRATPAAARCRPWDRRTRSSARLGRALTPGTPPADGRGVRRGVPRRQRHGAAPRCRAAARSIDGWIVVAARRMRSSTSCRCCAARSAPSSRPSAASSAAARRPARVDRGRRRSGRRRPRRRRRRCAGTGHRPGDARAGRRRDGGDGVDAPRCREPSGCGGGGCVLGGGDGRRHRRRRCAATTAASTPRSARSTTAACAAGGPAGGRRRPRPLGAVRGPVARRHPPLLPDAGGAGAPARRGRAPRPAPAAARTGAARRAEPDLHLVTLLVELNRLLPESHPGDGPPGRRRGARPARGAPRRPHPRRRCAARWPAQPRRAGPARPTSTGRARSGPTCATTSPSERTVVPERLVGFGRHQRSLARDVVIAIDQSGSMADSVVHAVGVRLRARPPAGAAHVARRLRHRGRRPHRRCSTIPSTSCSACSSAAARTSAERSAYCRRLVTRPRRDRAGPGQRPVRGRRRRRCCARRGRRARPRRRHGRRAAGAVRRGRAGLRPPRGGRAGRRSVPRAGLHARRVPRSCSPAPCSAELAALLAAPSRRWAPAGAPVWCGGTCC